jgi:hypothetical protein
MTFWLRLFIARFKTAAPPSFWVAFFLLSGFILALGLLFNRETGLRIRVGVLANDSALISRVQYYAAGDCEIVVYTDIGQMKLDVAAHKLECAYMLPYNGHETITAFRSPWTVSDGVLDLMVAAAYIEGIAGDLGKEVLEPFRDRMTDPDVNLAVPIQALVNEYLGGGALMEMIYVEPGDRVGEEPAAPYRRLFHGLTGLFGLLLALLCGMGLAETGTSALSRLQTAGRGAGGYALAGVAVVWLTTGLFITVTVLIGNIIYPGVVLNRGMEMVTGWGFSFAMAGLAALLAKLAKNDGVGLTAFIFIAAALLGGTVFDIREIWEAAAVTRFLFPNYYYLEGITRSSGQPALWGMGFAAAALAWAADSFKRRTMK